MPHSWLESSHSLEGSRCYFTLGCSAGALTIALQSSRLPAALQGPWSHISLPLQSEHTRRSRLWASQARCRSAGSPAMCSRCARSRPARARCWRPPAATARCASGTAAREPWPRSPQSGMPAQGCNINPNPKPKPEFITKPGCSDGALRIWDRGGGAGVGALSPVVEVRHARPEPKPEPSLDLTSASSNDALRIWDRGGGAGGVALSPVAAVRHAYTGDWVQDLKGWVPIVCGGSLCRHMISQHGAADKPTQVIGKDQRVLEIKP